MTVPITHTITERRAPTAIILLCSCGWRAQISRRQNARARTAQVEKAKRDHRAKAEA